MKILFLLIISLAIGCSEKSNSKVIEESEVFLFKKDEVVIVQQIKEKTDIFDSISSIIKKGADFIKISFEYIFNRIDIETNKQIELCIEGIYSLKEEWHNSFCDSLGISAKERCLDERKIIPEYQSELCRYIVYENQRTQFNDILLILSVIKNESDFGKIIKTKDGYSVTQDVCEQVIRRSNVSEIEDNCRRNNARRITFISSGNKICVYILSESQRYYTINTCVAHEAGLLQLISSDYFAGRIIPGTSISIPEGNREFRRSFINENLDYSIRIGIEELIEHRNIFDHPSDREKWYLWIGTYNTGDTYRRGQWMNYSIRILKNYIKLCQNENIRSYYEAKCDDLRNFRYYFEEN